MEFDPMVTPYDEIERLLKENAALRGEVERLKGIVIRDRDAELANLQAALSRYREALQWICSYEGFEYMESHHFIWAELERELKRRAGEGG